MGAMTNERSFLIIKPDALQRGLVGEVIHRLERKGLRLIGLKLITISRAQAEKQYACHHGKPFYERLLKFMTSGPSLVVVVTGMNAVKVVRVLVGATDPTVADPGSVRGDFSLDITQNIVHASDCPESVQHELPIFFTEQELVDYTPVLKPWVNYL
jgi:nucleoside-diphosphate kinase